MRCASPRVGTAVLAAVFTAFVLSNALAPRPILRKNSLLAAASQPTTKHAPKTKTIRIAEPGDLQVTLMTPPNPADHFPHATAKVYNAASEDVIVGYEPGCVVIHCGEYEQHAPGMTFTQRREILRPRQPLEFDVPPGGWMRSPTTGEQDLMLPVELPKGKYPVWATFKLSGSQQVVESPHEVYVVR